jgi:hypothetical protein
LNTPPLAGLRSFYRFSGSVPAVVETDSAFQSYLDGALAIYGIEADPVERSVIEGVFAIYQPPIERLLTADLDRIEPEQPLDLSRAPER